MFLSNYADEAHDRRSENDEKIIDKNEVRLEAGFLVVSKISCYFLVVKECKKFEMKVEHILFRI